MSHPSDTALRGLLDNPDGTGPTGVAAHLDGCPECQDRADRLTAVTDPLKLALAARPADRLGPPTLPGYADLAEVGRGGGGVVYRAREAATGRPVAVKVLRNGPLATAAERDRFRAEALAAARLRHPHVVTVHAVGGPEDLPFYAMEFVPGGSLAARLDGTPADPRAAAELVRAVAVGVDHAHAAGLVHRDIKPGNILLDPGPGPFGTPKLADFGTARGAPRSGDPTSTHAVLGTPQYMAPEQAAGRSREADPAADVYALGAVLYELLVGRPPFKWETPLETLRQVQQADPVTPRRLRPGLPKDLETVCLKCLEKEPRRRYGSAADLAADLGRFLAGRPVVARPVGPLGRAARAARRNPTVAGLLGLTAAVVVGSLVTMTVLWRRAEARKERAWEVIRRYAVLAQRVAALDLAEPEWDDLGVTADLSLQALDEADGDPDRQGEVAYTVLQIADALLQGGRVEPAEDLTRRAAAVLGRLAADHPADRKHRRRYIDGCNQHATLLSRLGRLPEYRDRLAEATRLAEGLVAERPDSDDYQTVLAGCWAMQARDLTDRGDPVAAAALLDQSIAAQRALLDRHPTDPHRYRLLGHTMLCRARLVLGAGRPPHEYLAGVREMADLGCRALVLYHYYSGRAHDLLGGLPTLVHALDRLGQTAAADEVVAQVSAAWQAHAGDHPGDAVSAAAVAAWQELDGWRRLTTGPAEAGDRFRAAVAAARRAHERAPIPDYAAILARLLATCPDPEVRRPAEAVELARGITATAHRWVFGAALYEDGKFEEARAVLEAVAAGGVDGRLYLVLARHRTGATAEARGLLREVAATADADPYLAPDTRALLARAEREVGQVAGRAPGP